MQRDLVERAQRGDVDAFTVLAEQALGRLHGVAYRILGDCDAADDATQQALIAVWDHLGSLRDPERFEAWSYRLVVRAAYKVARRERSQHDRVRFINPAGHDSADPTVQIADCDELDQAFRSLSPEQRAVLVLHYFADLPHAEIADILGIPTGTVGSRLHHATRRLRVVLEADAVGVMAGRQAV